MAARNRKYGKASGKSKQNSFSMGELSRTSSYEPPALPPKMNQNHSSSSDDDETSNYTESITSRYRSTYIKFY